MREGRMQRKVVHLDADAFFASVEQASDTRLRGKPVAVGGEKRGVIAAASYEARRFGIRAAMPTLQARKLCPHLILLPGDYEKYERFSRWMFSYAYDFTPDVEITSIDEGYFDLTGVRCDAPEVARRIHRAIGQSLKISVSEGMGPNKLISQIASKLHKPAAFQSVEAGYEEAFLHPLANHWLPGIGPKTSARLCAAGLARIGQLAGTRTDLLHLLLGRMAPQIRAFAAGEDDRPIVPVSAPAKSYGKQKTFPKDQTDEDLMVATLKQMADTLMARVRGDGKSIRTLSVKVRYNDMEEDQCSESLDEPTDLENEVYDHVSRMLRKAWRRRVSLRLVALKFSNVHACAYRDELLLDRAAERRVEQARLVRVMDSLRRRCGPHVVMRGHDWILRDQSGEGKASMSSRSPGGNGGACHKYRSSGHGVDVPSTSGKGGAVRGQTSSGRSMKRVAKRQRYDSGYPVCLNVKSHYSFLNSVLSVKQVVDLAVQQGHSAVALMDEGNLHGSVAFHQYATQRGIQPLIGAQIRVGRTPLLLYVQTQQGYQNLCQILSTRAEKPAPMLESPLCEKPTHRVSRYRSNWTLKQLQSLPTDGLLAVGGDPSIEPLFSRRFYLGVDPFTGSQSSRWQDIPFPKVAVPAIHYATSEDRWKLQVVQSIRTRTLLKQAHPDKSPLSQAWFPTSGSWDRVWETCAPWMPYQQEIVERCRDFRMPLGAPHFPEYHPPDGATPREFLYRLVMRGLKERYPSAKRQRVMQQVEEELETIREVGYEAYFLMVWDLLQACRREGISWITRGSAADSLVCYCLRISDVCPKRFELYFRRFLNRDRMALNKLPDIDVDFPHDRKDDVVRLVFQKYGQKHAAVVGGFSTYHSRGAMGDVAKVLGVSEQQIRRLTKRFPYARARDMRAFLLSQKECRDLPLNEEPYASALTMAESLDGAPRYAKMHPCGLVLSGRPIHDLTPTFLSEKGYPTTHLDMDAVEAMGLVKMDILAQGGLSVMRDVSRMLAQRGVTIEIEPGRGCRVLNDDDVPGNGSLKSLENPWEDSRVWDMISAGGARAVHHIESPAMVNLCRMCQVRDIDGLVAIVSVIRPGAANEQKKLRFTRRYQKLEPTVYPHPSLESCLRSTFGLVVYEEHILQICESFAGLSPGRSDVLRRALNKGKEETIEAIRCEFFERARDLGRSHESIRDVWTLVRGFNGYAFCKAHSTAYGVEAYQSAWLKCYFPMEFMAAVLTHGKGFYHPLVYVLECDRMGIGLLPPSIQAPGPGYQAVHESEEGPSKTGGIRVPISAIKGLSQQTLDRLMEQWDRSNFVSLSDFYHRVWPQEYELELLMRVGALDGFGLSRTAQFWQMKQLSHAFSGHSINGQGWLLPPQDKHRLPSVPLEEPPLLQRLDWEQELIGFPVSAHPLDRYPEIAWETYCPVNRLGDYIGKEVTTCGLVIEQRLHHQVTGEPMKFLTLADRSGLVETELFATTYRSYGLATVRYPVLEVTARVEPFENNRGFSLRVLRAGKPRTRKAMASVS